MADKNVIYNMKMHETIEFEHNLYATRVPGGWIYTTVLYEHAKKIGVTSCFVPRQSLK